MEIFVLGSVSVQRNGEEVSLGPRLRRVFAALLVEHDRVVSVDRLVDVVWQGDAPDGADKSLKTYMTRLRQALDPDRTGLIEFSEPGYVLRLDRALLDRYALDSDRFEAELDDAVRMHRTSDEEGAIASLVTALARWRGPAYAGFADEEWVRPVAVRLEARRLEATELLIEARLASGDHDQAIADAQSLVESEPLRERPRALLMRALYATARQTDALREFHSYRELLVDESGLDPSSDLFELEARIARSDPSLAGATRALRGYELCERVGQGAFAVVHRAIQPGIDRDVAVKIIRSELADRPEFVRRFEHEAQIVASVEHPHVVPIYDYWREPGAAFIVMRLLRGGSVEDALRAHGPFSRRAAIDLLREIGGALEAAHRKGVVHRDVRPANLLRDEQGVTYLADFGIALTTATADATFVASPAYASPELLRGEPVGIAADVHSLGITTFELLTGRLPFADSNDRAELIRRQLAEPLPSARAVRTDLPMQIDDVLARATAKASGDRYATVSALVADLVAVLDTTTTNTPTPMQLSSEPIENPYVGLNAFDERHSSSFFGRSALVTELVESLATKPLVVVVGPSGSGKSSVVRAGLVPALRRGALPGSDEWLMTTLVPGADPIDALEVALLRVAVNPPASLRQQLREPGGLLRAIRRVLPGDDARLLIVIDQFEELFTMADADEHERFLGELAAAITAPDAPVRVVATLRADHYDVPLQHPTFAGIATDGTVTVRPMSPSELEEVIVKPAASVGVEVEPALVAELVAGVSERSAALPLLQFALTEVFERRISGVMLASVHHELGGLTGAVAATADRIVDSGDEADAAESRLIFGRLVTLGEGAEDTRRRALWSEFGDGERTAWLLDAFAGARLLTLDRDAATRQPTVEVAHEALLRDWPRLRSWLQEDRVDLRGMRTIGAAATAWQTSGREDAELAGGGRLTVAAELFERRPERFNELEAAWVTASSAAADAEARATAAAAEKDRHQNRRLRQLLVAAVGLLAVAVAAAGVAVVLRGRAVASEERAVVAREDADIGRIAALSATQAGVAPEVSILLALEAHRRRDDLDTQSALQQSIAATSEILELRSEPLGEASLTSFSRDGRVALTRTISFEAATAGWFDTETGAQIGSFFRSDVGIEASAISADGSTTAFALVDGTIRITGTSGEELVPAIRVGTSIRGLSLDRTGDRLLVLGDFEFTIIDIDRTDGGSVVSTAQVDEDGELGGVVDIIGTLSDDGSFFVVEFDNRTPAPDGLALEEEVTAGYDIVDAATGERIERVAAAEVRTIALSSANTLVVGYADGRVDVRSLETDDEATNLASFGGAIEMVGIRWDGSIGVVDQSGLRLWGPDGSLLLGPMSIGGSAANLGFREDGAAVVALLGGGTIVVDPLASAMIDQSHPTDLSNNVFTELPYYEARTASGTTAQFRRFSDNEVQKEIPIESIYPNGYGADPFYSSDGVWSLTLGVEDTDPQVVTEVLGDRRYVVDVVSAYENAVGSSFSLESIYTGRPAVDGKGLFFAVDDPTRAGALAMWIDTTTSEVVAGPVELTSIGPAFTLPDGRVVLGAPEGVIQILPADLDNEPIVLVPGTEGFGVFDQDENTDLMLIGAADGRVGILDLETATFRLLDNAPGALTAGSFSPRGDRVAVLAPEVGLQLLDVASGRRIGVVMGLRGPILRQRAVRWAEDGSGVWVATTDGPVRFAADSDRWRDIACGVVDRELTLDEWQRFVSATEPPTPACAGGA